MNKVLYKCGLKWLRTPEFAGELANCREVIVSLLCRYGAAVQALQAILRFSDKHPNCRLNVVTSPQLSPYVDALLRGKCIMHIVSRNNPISVIRTLFSLGINRADLGFNPWSSGPDGLFFASLAKSRRTFSVFWKARAAQGRNFERESFHDFLNAYFGIEQESPTRSMNHSLPELPTEILVCPESSGPQRTLDLRHTLQLCEYLQSRWPDAHLTVAAADSQYALMAGQKNMPFLRLKKSVTSSRQLIERIQAADLVVAVDSGPLNIAIALERPVLALFSNESPERVLPRNLANATVLRHPRMSGVSCQNAKCREPLCLWALFDDKDIVATKQMWQSGTELKVFEDGCPWLGR
jgi:hypothetical protein